MLSALVFNVNLIDYGLAFSRSHFAASAEPLTLSALGVDARSGSTVVLVGLIVFLLFVSLFTKAREQAR